MTAPTPASGLPQEAVDAAAWSQLSEADLRSYRVWRNAQLRDALAAERAKVAALQQAVDKVRALVDAPADRPSIASDIYADGHQDGYELAMTRVHRVLPDVQADDRGTCACSTPFFTHGGDGTWCNACRQPYVSRFTPEEIAAAVRQHMPLATTCADCGTTRTVCDAGLNTYDTRCCDQCGHGEGK